MTDTVLDQAIGWLVKLESSSYAPELCAACLAWRQADPQHETTWQALQEAQKCFSEAAELPGGVALSTLRSADRRRALKALALALLATGLGASAVQESPWRVSFADYSTRTGQRHSITLTDGTALQLDSRSAVDVRYTPTQRQLFLREGQIHVRCDRDAENRVFSVSSGQCQFTALTAAFEVSQEAGYTRLGVDEGAVAIQLPGQPSLRAVAGEQYRVDDNIRRLDAPTSTTSAWTRGLLITHHMPLQQLAANLGRQRAGWLGCDPAIAGLTVSGVFQLDDIPNALQALSHTLPVRVIWRTELWGRIVPA